jgi:hypothetical protein
VGGDGLAGYSLGHVALQTLGSRLRVLLGAKHLIFKVDAEDLDRIEAKVDDIKDSLGLPTPPPS